MSDARIFISYARKDGEDFAGKLRKRLEQDAPDISVWQDRARMEGGRDWWQQVVEALEVVQFLVLCMTPEAMKSEVVRLEWRRARELGVCIYPVKAAPDGQLQYDTLPKWMAAAHFFDLDKEWPTFLGYLRSPCHAVRVPFMAPELPQGFVQRLAESNRLLRGVLDENSGNPRVGSVALVGSGGFGKSTLATDLCHRDEVMTAFDGGVLWATLGEEPNVLRELSKLYAALTGERPAFFDSEDAAYHLAEKLSKRRCLLVIDDVWHKVALKPFLRVGRECAVVITTRLLDISAEAGERIDVGEMKPVEAAELLTARLSPAETDLAQARTLAERLGEWPILLDLANAALRLRVEQGDTFAGALRYVKKAFDRRGVTVFDRENATERNDAIAKTLEASLETLSAEEGRHYSELAIFPPDAAVPLAVMETLWKLDDFDTEDLTQKLARRSLLQHRLPERTIRLHNSIQAYLRKILKQPGDLHARLADQWTNPGNPGANGEYARTHALYHIAEAMEGAPTEQVRRRGWQVLTWLSDSAYREFVGKQSDLSSLCRNLRRALDSILPDSSPEASLLVAGMALELGKRLSKPADPQNMFSLALKGEVRAAEERLDLFDAEPFWQKTALLLIAWLACGTNPGDARALRQSVAPQLDDFLLHTLLQWVDASMSKAPLPATASGSTFSLYDVHIILERLGGTGEEQGGEAINPSALGGGDEMPAFLAEQDGPVLVAFAWQDRKENTQYLQRYIEMHASNPYKYYRNRSLAALAGPIMRHFPDAEWVRARMAEVTAAALTQKRAEFHEALPIALLALRARSGDPGAANEMETRRENALQEANELAPLRCKADSWGFCLRRLAALAEAYAVILNNRAVAKDLIREALKLPFGYAGFWARACLTLAESARIVDPGDPSDSQDALHAALRSAHNVQDSTYCALTTATVNAMRLRWWPQPGEAAVPVQDWVSALVHDPRSPELQPTHCMAERYTLRIPGPHMLPPPQFTHTIMDVAALYRCAETELHKLDPYPRTGEEIAVPSSEFAALLAARFASEVLGSAASEDNRRELLHRLIPVALENPTALDTLLARTILAAGCDDQAVLGRLTPLL